jgi:hypothetical protein
VLFSAVIAEALNKILAEDVANNNSSNMLAEAVEAALRQDSVSTEEISKFLALPKASDVSTSKHKDPYKCWFLLSIYK